MNTYKSETQAQKDKLASNGKVNHTKQLRKEKRAMAKASRRKAKEIINDK